MDKWLAICIVGFVIGMFSPVIVSEHNKSECRIEGIKAKLSSDEITKICK